MLFLLLSIFELIILFIVSQMMSRSLSKVFFRLTRSNTATIYFLSILFFPGVIIHELSHLFMASVLFVPTGEIEFFPQIQENNRVKLGSVGIGKTDPFRRALIGFAPIISGISLLVGIFYSFYHLSFSDFSKWQIAVGLYVVFEIGNTMFSSKKDAEGTLVLSATVGIFAIVLYALGVRIPASVFAFLNSAAIVTFFQQVAIFFLAPLLLDVLIIGLTKLLLR